MAYGENIAVDNEVKNAYKQLLVTMNDEEVLNKALVVHTQLSEHNNQFADVHREIREQLQCKKNIELARNILASAKNTCCECADETTIEYDEMTKTLITIGLGPWILDIENASLTRVNDTETKHWLVISYTQDVQQATKILTISNTGKMVLMQQNVWNALCYVQKELQQFSISTGMLLWWDGLSGEVVGLSDNTWPALANMHYMTQHVLTVPPNLPEEGDVAEVTKNFVAQLNRAWPFTERMLAAQEARLLITMEDMVNTWKGLQILSITIFQMVCTCKCKDCQQINDAYEENNLKLIYGNKRWARDVALKKIDLTGENKAKNDDICQSNGWTRLEVLHTLRALSKAFGFINGTRIVVDGLDTVEENVISIIKGIIGQDTNVVTLGNRAIKEINYLMTKKEHERIQESSLMTRHSLIQMAHIRSKQLKYSQVAAELLRGSPSYMKNYVPGDKLVAAYVLTDTKAAVQDAQKWLAEGKHDKPVFVTLQKSHRRCKIFVGTRTGLGSEHVDAHILADEGLECSHCCLGIATNLMGTRAYTEACKISGLTIGSDNEQHMYAGLQARMLLRATAIYRLEYVLQKNINQGGHQVVELPVLVWNNSTHQEYHMGLNTNGLKDVGDCIGTIFSVSPGGNRSLHAIGIMEWNSLSIQYRTRMANSQYQKSSVDLDDINIIRKTKGVAKYARVNLYTTTPQRGEQSLYALGNLEQLDWQSVQTWMERAKKDNQDLGNALEMMITNIYLIGLKSIDIKCSNNFVHNLKYVIHGK